MLHLPRPDQTIILSNYKISILVVFHFGHLSFWSFSVLVVFHFGRLPFWSSSILVVFYFGRLSLLVSTLYDIIWQSAWVQQFCSKSIIISLINALPGRRPKWKMTKMEDDQNVRWPKLKTTKMEVNQNRRTYYLYCNQPIS